MTLKDLIFHSDGKTTMTVDYRTKLQVIGFSNIDYLKFES